MLFALQFEEGSRPDPKLFGLIPRSFQYLFRMMNQNVDGMNRAYRLKASYLEIYNEQVVIVMVKPGII